MPVSMYLYAKVKPLFSALHSIPFEFDRVQMSMALCVPTAPFRTLDNYTNIFNVVKEHDEKSIVKCIQPKHETTTLYRIASINLLKMERWHKKNANSNPESGPKRGTNWDLSFYSTFCCCCCCFVSFSLESLFRLIFYTFYMCSLFIHFVSFNYILAMLHVFVSIVLCCFHSARESHGWLYSHLFWILHFIWLFWKAQNVGNFSSPLLYLQNVKHIECKVIFSLFHFVLLTIFIIIQFSVEQMVFTFVINS